MDIKKAVLCLEALSNETRLNIFKYMVRTGSSGISVGEIQKELGVPNSTLSHHIAKLVKADLIFQQRESRTLFCKTNYEQMDSLISFLSENCCINDSGNK
ncbi:MAG: winged helix-turn-helix transcriptional regulator [Proteobacteria bacterium]|nr:winged helix-turn-helix transcriptional regulator [Pseudomonadota bacterium]